MISNKDRGEKKKEGGNSTTKVFGVPFDRTSNTIPGVIKRVVEYFDVKGVEIEGLFRISGGFSEVNKLKAEFDEGKNPELFDISDPHVCAGLLKQYLRELPEPLLTFELYDCFLASASVPEEALADTIKKVLTMLPSTHRIILKYLIAFLNKVTQASQINKMHPANIAIVFAPNLLKPQSDDIATQITDTPYSNKLMELFVQQYHVIFKDEPDEPPISMRTSNNIPLTNSNNIPLNNNNNYDPLRISNNTNYNSNNNNYNNNSINNTNITSPIRSSNQNNNFNDQLRGSNNIPINDPLRGSNNINNNNFDPLRGSNNNVNDEISVTNEEINQLSNFTSKPLPKPPNKSPINNNNNNNNNNIIINNNIENNNLNNINNHNGSEEKVPMRGGRRPAPARQAEGNSAFSQAPSIPQRPSTNQNNNNNNNYNTPPVPPRLRSNTVQKPDLPHNLEKPVFTTSKEF